MKTSTTFTLELPSRYTSATSMLDEYEITKTETGWHIARLPDSGQDCDHTGDPFFKRELVNAGVTFPSGLGDYFENIWVRADRGELDEQGIQKHFEYLFAWIAQVNETQPEGDWF